MAEVSRFFADIGGDRLTTAAQLNRIFDQLLQEKSGVIRGLGNTLAVTNAGTLSVDINTGSAIKAGRFYENTASVNIALSAVTSGSKRYDRVVIRVTDAARTMLLTVIEGTEAASPTPPAISGSTDVLLAKILIDRSSGSYAYTVTDERVYCEGQVSAVVIAALNAGNGAFLVEPGKATIDSAADDWDTFIAPGLYDVEYVGDGVHAPITGALYGNLISFSPLLNDAVHTQILFGTSPRRHFLRTWNGASWYPWEEIFTGYSSGNGGQPPAAKSNKTSNATIGWFDAIDVASGASATFPSGGTFEWWIPTYGATYNGVKSGINAGGALSGTASANLTIYYKRLSA